MTTNPRPALAVLATGGTIAGAPSDPADPASYTAGVLPATALLAAVPQLTDIADLRVETCLAMDSKDMTPAHWLQIARSAARLLAQPGIDGIVVTHGTDTLEETATFLDLVLDTDKPVVITGAMRPATAISADGPANLLDAIRVAAAPDSCGRGVLVVFGERIFPGAQVRKRHANRIDAFACQDGPGGHTRPRVRHLYPPVPHAPVLALPDALPPVEILHVAAGSAPAIASAAVERGACGLVLALPGNGSLPDYWEETVGRLVSGGTTVVRASRCTDGFVPLRALDGRLGTLAAGRLSPEAARVALMLALATRARTPGFDVPAWFDGVAGLAPAG